MTTYKEAGVDIDIANEGLKRIRKHVSSTFNQYTLSDIGSFGGCFNLPLNYKNPVLVSSVDGVGTKLLVASMANKHDTIGFIYLDKGQYCVLEAIFWFGRNFGDDVAELEELHDDIWNVDIPLTKKILFLFLLR